MQLLFDNILGRIDNGKAENNHSVLPAIISSYASVLLKSKNQRQRTVDTKNDVHAVDPIASGVSVDKMPNARNGGRVIIRCSKSEGTDKISSIAVNKLSDKYEVKKIVYFKPAFENRRFN